MAKKEQVLVLWYFMNDDEEGVMNKAYFTNSEELNQFKEIHGDAIAILNEGTAYITKEEL